MQPTPLPRRTFAACTSRPPALLIARIRTVQCEHRPIRRWVAFPAAFRPGGIDSKFPVAATFNISAFLSLYTRYNILAILLDFPMIYCCSVLSTPSSVLLVGHCELCCALLIASVFSPSFTMQAVVLLGSTAQCSLVQNVYSIDIDL